MSATRWWRLALGATAALMLLAIGAVGLWSARVGRELAAARARALAAGPPLELARLAPAPVPDAENAAVALAPLVARARSGACLLVARESWVANDDRLDAALRAVAEGRAPDAEARERARAFLRAAAEELAIVTRAVERPRWRFEGAAAVGRPWPAALGTSGLLEIQQALVARARLALDEGAWAEARADLVAALRLARASARVPSLVGVTIQGLNARLALDALLALAEAAPPELDLAPLLRELGEFELRSSLRLALAGERAFALEVLERCRAGADFGGLRTDPLLALPLYVDLQEHALLSDWEQALDAAGGPWHQLQARLEVLDRGRGERSWRRVPVSRLPRLARHGERIVEAEARLVLARLALRARGEGAAVALRAAAATDDPLCGAPVRAARAGAGAVTLGLDPDPGRGAADAALRTRVTAR